MLLIRIVRLLLFINLSTIWDGAYKIGRFINHSIYRSYRYHGNNHNTIKQSNERETIFIRNEGREL